MPPKVEVHIYKNMTILLSCLLFLVVGCIGYYLLSKEDAPSTPTTTPSPLACPVCPVCPVAPRHPELAIPKPDIVRERDEHVLRDDLYPPLGRSNTETTRMYATSVRPLPTRDTSDTFRLIGYIVSQEDREDSWKLYAREQHRNGRAEFYASPVNRNYDVKINLDNSVVTSKDQFRDIYSIPDEVKINHPMFSSSVHKVVQLPKADYTSGYI